MKKVIFSLISAIICVALLCSCALMDGMLGKLKSGNGESGELHSAEEITAVEFCDKFAGTWTADSGEFVVFLNEDSVGYYFTAIWNAGIGRGSAKIDRVISETADEYTLSVTFPAQEETMMYDAMDEYKTSFTVRDEKDGYITIKAEDGTVTTYFFDESRQFNMSGDSDGTDGPEDTSLPEFDEEELWLKLGDYWTNYEEGNFVGFFEENSVKQVIFGIWNAGGGRGFGEITSMYKIADNLYGINVYFPAVPENEMEGPYEEEYLYMEVTLVSDENISVYVANWDFACAYEKGRPTEEF